MPGCFYVEKKWKKDKIHHIRERAGKLQYASGDIDSRFTTNASALDGIRLHRKRYRKNPENYQSEVTLQHIKDYSDFADPGQGRRHNRGPGIRDKSHGR